MIPGNINTDLISGADEGGYQVDRSLRFNSADSAFLSRTPASAGNRKTWTWSGWVKRSGLGVRQNIFGTADASFFNGFWAEFFSDDKIRIGDIGPSTLDLELKSTQVFRDCSAWGHLFIAVDTTQATASNRVSAYWNGAKIEAFDTASYPTQNFDTRLNTTAAHGIGRAGSYNAQYFSGYLADIHFIDGQALTPSSFAETNATTGQWVPKAYTGSYGTNGFRLDFSDNSAATATTLGKDRAGSNNWTPNNLSVTAGAGNDSFVDTPTSYGTDTGAGGEVRGNYATLNPLAGAQTLANGNLDFSNNTTDSHRPSTIAMTTGKWYCEFTTSSYGGVPGLVPAGFTGTYPGQTSNSWGWYGGIGVYNNAGNIFSSTFGANDIIQIAFDADSGKLWFGKNGTWLNSGNPAAGTGQIATASTGTWHFAAGGSVVGAVTLNANFGQRPFAYTAPSGFKALCDTSLPAPTIAKPSTVFDVKLYTGNGSTQTISGLGFSPDFVWIKGRSFAEYHGLFDTVRGTGKVLFSNATDAENSYTASTQNLTAFNSDGFSLGTDGPVGTNRSSTTYAAWAWDAGASTVTNTQGSITSQVRANASAGFSIVTYTGNGSLATVGHGLGVKPGFFVIKRRNVSSEWTAYHSALGATKYITLQSTAAAVTTVNAWNNTEPTSSVLTINNVYGDLNANGGTYVIYAWAPVAGYSSFGSYTGNGSADGPFVYCGFRPRWVMVKRTDAARDWFIYDAARNTFNIVNNYLRANLSDAEGTNTLYPFDFLSNGFKLRSSETDINGSGGTWIYAAFAENPFQYARAR